MIRKGLTTTPRETYNAAIFELPSNIFQYDVHLVAGIEEAK